MLGLIQILEKIEHNSDRYHVRPNLQTIIKCTRKYEK